MLSAWMGKTYVYSAAYIYTKSLDAVNGLNLVSRRGMGVDGVADEGWGDITLLHGT